MQHGNCQLISPDTLIRALKWAARNIPCEVALILDISFVISSSTSCILLVYVFFKIQRFPSEEPSVSRPGWPQDASAESFRPHCYREEFQGWMWGQARRGAPGHPADSSALCRAGLQQQTAQPQPDSTQSMAACAQTLILLLFYAVAQPYPLAQTRICFRPLQDMSIDQGELTASSKPSLLLLTREEVMSPSGLSPSGSTALACFPLLLTTCATAPGRHLWDDPRNLGFATHTESCTHQEQTGLPGQL